MADTWTPVEPLADDDLDQRYWREPKQGHQAIAAGRSRVHG